MSNGYVKRSIRLRSDLARRLADHASARRASQTAVIEAALESFLSPDASDRLEAALARRLDRLNRDLARLEWHVELSNETLALFIRNWLSAAPASPNGSDQVARAQARERWERFVVMLNRRMEHGPRLMRELSGEHDGK
ncbi:CopG family transcriptional regulator [Sphingomonas fennica]|uniref:CopG family transcriptional regulator n=1 Tax=Edaphosphingomonas fennica TaxID=114404 RepID=A0A2T4HUW5_9SPHN|nr:CopG family transcriptional regulator [Sphingomonas fennica]PTD19575.1 CopG family transcriptional regulator [Sphingomonas fennica]